MSDTLIEPGGAEYVQPNIYNPIFHASYAPGTPVAIMDAAEAPVSGIVPDSVIAAGAASANVAYAIGVVVQTANAGSRGWIRYSGPVTLPSWADVLDTGSVLTQGVPYYLSPTAGRISKSAPDVGGQFVTPIGYALSPNSLFVQISFPTAA
jgi:hypothetical protein